MNERNLAGQRFSLTPERPIYIVLAESRRRANPSEIDGLLDDGRSGITSRLMNSSGAAADCADAIQRLVGFFSAYDPEFRLRFLPVNRDWTGYNSFPIMAMWDNFFDSYLGGIHRPELGKEALCQILEWIRTRGFKDSPAQRNLIIPVVYSKMVRFVGDRDFAAATLPAIMKFIRFFFADRGDGRPWRDGNDDGLIELGTCYQPGDVSLGTMIQNVFDETGYDDSPMYSAGFAYERRGLLADGVEFLPERGTLNLTMIGQNSMYVAACRATAVVAEWVGAPDERGWLLAEADRVGSRIKELLFDKERGYFQNRFFDGSFSPVKTMDIFYPLMAGICDEKCQEKLRGILLDPAQFWGEQVIPTVSRDDPAYCDESLRDAYWKGNYWRGNIWPPTNYMTYLSIRQAGWDDVASEFSEKSRRMFMADWLPRRHAHENYPPEPVGNDRTRLFTGQGGRDPHYLWAALLPLISLEELFSVEDVDDGIRFGSLQARSWGEWEGFVYHCVKGRIVCGANGLSLTLPGLLEVKADKPIAIRAWTQNGGEARFRYSANDKVVLKIKIAGADLELKLEQGKDKPCALPRG